MHPGTVAAIIDKVAVIVNFSDDIEISMEANPTSVESSKFACFKSAGVNRMSLGIQSFNENDLKFLGRVHSATEAIAAIEIAAKYFVNYSFDLIYGRPNQDLASWQKELEFAIQLASCHISLYQLTIEKGTPFFAQYRRKSFALPSQELAFELYELTDFILERNGYQRYEVSNYAKPGFASKHNLVYWNYGNYLGIGPGAHSRISFADASWFNKMQAVEMIYNPAHWLTKVEQEGGALKEISVLSKQDTLTEIMMMGLRLKGGIDNAKLLEFSGQTFVQIADSSILDQLLEQNLLEIIDGKQRLTTQGLALHSSILSRLL
jgi:oxygen-independent coproporphyrinogen-3 oxidase